MSESLLSVGLDVGTTSTQLVISCLQVENRASGFAVPEMEITDRQVLYRSPVYFTPLAAENLVDGKAIRRIVEAEYARAGISRKDVDTGAIIITGETSRRENAGRVLEALAEFAGDFVVATAGPDLESILAAKGAGAVEYARKTGKTVLHMDIGGGTSNFALIREGEIVQTGCLNVGGRLVKFSDSGAVTYLSPVVSGLSAMKLGETPSAELRMDLAQLLAQALEMAAGRRLRTELLDKLMTKEAVQPWVPPGETVVVSFSGGVADCIGRDVPDMAYGDLGPELGRAIGGSSLCGGEYVLGKETIRATVIGAGCHSTQLSGSTVYYQNIRFPLKNLPVAAVSGTGDIQRSLAKQESQTVFSLPGKSSPSYREITRMAEEILHQMTPPILLCLQQDMAKALGQALALRMPEDAQILCIDRVHVGDGSYLDIGAPVGGAMPVVVKTLVLSK